MTGACPVGCDGKAGQYPGTGRRGSARWEKGGTYPEHPRGYVAANCGQFAARRSEHIRRFEYDQEQCAKND